MEYKNRKKNTNTFRNIPFYADTGKPSWFTQGKYMWVWDEV